MTALTVIVIIATFATVIVLATGIGSMAHGGEFDRKHSLQLMTARVGLQGLVFALILLTLLLTALVR